MTYIIITVDRKTRKIIYAYGFYSFNILKLQQKKTFNRRIKKHEESKKGRNNPRRLLHNK